MVALLCSCGREFVGKSQASVETLVRRCKKEHFDPGCPKLQLADGDVGIRSTLFVVLSHSGQHHHDRRLKQALHDVGARDVLVVYGAKFGKQKHRGRLVKYNKICHYSVRYRWWVQKFDPEIFFQERATECDLVGI